MRAGAPQASVSQAGLKRPSDTTCIPAMVLLQMPRMVLLRRHLDARPRLAWRRICLLTKSDPPFHSTPTSRVQAGQQHDTSAKSRAREDRMISQERQCVAWHKTYEAHRHCLPIRPPGPCSRTASQPRRSRGGGPLSFLAAESRIKLSNLSLPGQTCRSVIYVGSP